MGLYDTVVMTCPNCHHGKVEFQTKTGEPSMARFRIEDAPLAMRFDIEGDVEPCPVCQESVEAPMPPGRLSVAGMLGEIERNADKPSLVRLLAQDTLRAYATGKSS